MLIHSVPGWSLNRENVLSTPAVCTGITIFVLVHSYLDTKL